MTGISPSLLVRLSQGLKRSVLRLHAGGRVDEALFEELEASLLLADAGLEATREILKRLRTRATEQALTDGGALRAALADELTAILKPAAQPLALSAAEPFVILAVGVNGVGKTTTLAKLAERFRRQGKSVLLAAGDTFRAAAVEQLQTWGARQQVPVIAQAAGADPAAVAHDALVAARARGTEVLLVDTAGRLHTQGGLMEELRKVRRVLARLDADAPHECLLVLDAGSGQNVLKQIEQFHAAVQVTGLVLTKLDGTAKGGILLAATRRFGLPIRYIGVGEQAEDLLEFDALAFAAALAGVSA